MGGPLVTNITWIPVESHWFSALRYLETYLRFTTKEARLNELVLLFVHHDLTINFKHVIDKFSCKNRRLDFD